jgi:hypothetical protein
MLINNDDESDKAHTMTVAFNSIARARYGEVATDKRASSSLALFSLWYRHLSVHPNLAANIIQWQQSPSSFSSPATQSSNGQLLTSNLNSDRAFLSLHNQYPHNNLCQDLNTPRASSTLSKMPSSPNTQMLNNNYKWTGKNSHTSR